MEVGDAETQASRGLEAGRGCVHTDGRWGEGVVGRENQGAPILAIFIVCFRRTCEDVVPPNGKGGELADRGKRRRSDHWHTRGYCFRKDGR